MPNRPDAKGIVTSLGSGSQFLNFPPFCTPRAVWGFFRIIHWGEGQAWVIGDKLNTSNNRFNSTKVNWISSL